MKKFKSINGFYKFYNRLGTSCRIKCSEKTKGQLIIKFKDMEAERWLYHVPDKKFAGTTSAINFILKNLDKENQAFVIMPIHGGIE